MTPPDRTDAVNSLRRVLYLQAAVWTVAGVALAVAPRSVLAGLFGQPALDEPAWHRLLGVHAVGLAMLMVLVAHRAEELWWWSWAFCLGVVATAVVAVLNAAFGVPPGRSTLAWWVLAAVSVAFALGLLYALSMVARERQPG